VTETLLVQPDKKPETMKAKNKSMAAERRLLQCFISSFMN